jgi:hypothetical protein
MMVVTDCIWTQWANDIRSRAQLRRSVQHGHDPVQRCERCYDGRHQKDEAYICEIVKFDNEHIPRSFTHIVTTGSQDDLAIAIAC